MHYIVPSERITKDGRYERLWYLLNYIMETCKLSECITDSVNTQVFSELITNSVNWYRFSESMAVWGKYAYSVNPT
jgi:hypothetical protein